MKQAAVNVSSGSKIYKATLELVLDFLSHLLSNYLLSNVGKSASLFRVNKLNSSVFISRKYN
jgi:hypothetical protein